MDISRKEYWSVGILEYWKKPKAKFQLGLVPSVLHCSITPLLRKPQEIAWDVELPLTLARIIDTLPLYLRTSRITL